MSLCLSVQVVVYNDKLLACCSAMLQCVANGHCLQGQRGSASSPRVAAHKGPTAAPSHAAGDVGASGASQTFSESASGTLLGALISPPACVSLQCRTSRADPSARGVLRSNARSAVSVAFLQGHCLKRGSVQNSECLPCRAHQSA